MGLALVKESLIFCVLVPWKENWARKGTHPKTKHLVDWWAEDKNRWVGPTSQGKGDKNFANLTPAFFFALLPTEFPWEKLLEVIHGLMGAIAAFLI